MSTVGELDSVRTTVAAEALEDRRVIPPGAEGAVLAVMADGAILVEIAVTPQTRDTDGDFVQIIVAEGQYEVTHARA